MSGTLLAIKITCFAWKQIEFIATEYIATAIGGWTREIVSNAIRVCTTDDIFFCVAERHRRVFKRLFAASFTGDDHSDDVNAISIWQCRRVLNAIFLATTGVCACTEQSVIINNPIGAGASRERRSKNATIVKARYTGRSGTVYDYVSVLASFGLVVPDPNRFVSWCRYSQSLTSFFTIGFLVYFNVGVHSACSCRISFVI